MSRTRCVDRALPRVLAAFLIVSAVGSAVIPAAEACSSRDAMWVAKQNRGSEEYAAAREVAIEFIDAEGFERDLPVVETGTGVLMFSLVGGPLRRRGESRRGFQQGGAEYVRSRLDKATECHGRTRDGRNYGIYTSWYGGEKGNEKAGTATLRDHLRLHVWATSKALRGEYTPDEGGQDLRELLKDIYTADEAAPLTPPANFAG